MATFERADPAIELVDRLASDTDELVSLILNAPPLMFRVIRGGRGEGAEPECAGEGARFDTLGEGGGDKEGVLAREERFHLVLMIKFCRDTTMITKESNAKSSITLYQLQSAEGTRQTNQIRTVRET